MDDRTVFITLLDHAYPLCLTVEAQSDITRLCGSLDNIGSLFNDEDMPGTLANIVKLLHILIKGGVSRARVRDFLDGTETSKQLVDIPEEALAAILSPGDFPSFQQSIFTAIRDGLGSTVEAEPQKGKKQEATQHA